MVKTKEKKQEYKENELLEIEWVDTTTVQNWHSPNSKLLTINDGLSECKSVGFFLRQTKKSIQITQALCDDGGRCNTQVIPLSTITKIKRVK